MSAELFPETPHRAVRSSATLSDDGRFRFDLTRRWDAGPTFCWVMLNPSTADAAVDDPTLRAVMAFSRAAGAGRAVVVNLFAFRTPHPAHLVEAPDPVGPGNDRYIDLWAHNAARVVVAWGALDRPSWVHNGRSGEVLDRLSAARDELWCVDRTRAGRPRHPLYADVGRGLVRWA